MCQTMSRTVRISQPWSLQVKANINWLNKQSKVILKDSCLHFFDFFPSLDITRRNINGCYPSSLEYFFSIFSKLVFDFFPVEGDQNENSNGDAADDGAKVKESEEASAIVSFCHFYNIC